MHGASLDDYDINEPDDRCVIHVDQTPLFTRHLWIQMARCSIMHLSMSKPLVLH